SRLPMEVGIMGWKFTLIRVASTFFFPPLAGLMAQALFGGVKDL
ncbi:MAG: permease, partial [Deltaproteobacteria bacterium]